jgi:hypothetical protein
VDHRSDIYSLALVVFECLTGQMAFSGSTAEVVSRQLDDPPPRLSDLAPQYAQLDPPLLRALSKDPAQRQQRASGLAMELAKACGMDAGRMNEPLAYVGTAEVVALEPSVMAAPVMATPEVTVMSAPAPAVDAMALAETILEGDTVPHRRVDPHTVLFHDTLPPVDPTAEHGEDDSPALDVNDTVTDPPRDDADLVVRTSTALPRRSRRSFLAVGLFLGVVVLFGVAIAVWLARSGLETTAEAPKAVVSAVPLPDARPPSPARTVASPDMTADAPPPDTAPPAPDTHVPPDLARRPRSHAKPRRQAKPAAKLGPKPKPAAKLGPKPKPAAKPGPAAKPRPKPATKQKEGDLIRF